MRFKSYIYLIVPSLIIICLFLLSNYLFLFPSIRNNIIDEKKIMLKELTHVALDIIDNCNASNKDSLSQPEIKILALEQIRNINYGDDKKSYFWITDLAPTMIMHPYRQDLEGTLLLHYQDINGFELFKTALDIVTKEGEGYLEYYWQWQDDSTKVLPKITYVTIYKEWGWVVGTGMYIDNIELELQTFRKNQLKSFLIISALILVFFFSIIFFGLKLEKHRVTTQKELMSNEEKFRILFQNSDDILIVSDLNGIIIDINKKSLATYGMNYDEVVGKTTYQMMPEKYHEMIKERVKASLTEDLPALEIELKLSNGNLIPVETKTSLLTLHNSMVLLSTMRDITDRKKAEEELLQTNKNLEASETKFKNLSNMTVEGIVFHRNGVLLDTNLSMLNMFGYSQAELLNMDVVEFLFDEDSKRTIKLNIVNNYTIPYEATGIKKGGVKFPIEIEGKNYHTDGSGESLRVTAFRDITDRKMHEKQVLNAIISGEEKERTRIAKELHDGLGPYLSTIKFYFQWLGESDDNEKKKIIIEKGNKSMQEAITILREISNNLNPHILTNYGLMDAIAAFIAKFDENDLLQFEFTPLEDVKVSHSVEVALYRIIIELINNTLKHANASKICITFKIVNSDQLKMIYSDNGIGFNFEPTKKNIGGLGLLNIQHRISTLDGELEFKTSPNNGFLAKVLLNTF